jgi:uncharacterized protein with PQ loop repeat
MVELPLLAGAISSAMFVIGTLPMIHKAFATKNLQSYSMSSLLLNNVGNLLHALYVYSLPPGPIWLLHTFNLITTALMLFWYVRYEGRYQVKVRSVPLLWTVVMQKATTLVPSLRSAGRALFMNDSSRTPCCTVGAV